MVNKIFISRKNNTKRGRVILNEDELFHVLEKYGFAKYYLEDMSIEEQIELFYDAKFVMGTHGAGLSNLIFSSNIQVLELFPMKEISPYYYYLSKVVENNYNYWCGNANSFNANFYVDINIITRYLSKTY